jgi:hypothetical protein
MLALVASIHAFVFSPGNLRSLRAKAWTLATNARVTLK